ncbi:magnesium transporter [Microbacterium protaetiae]|uniref:Magnesium transporter MgtE n=1 Tax=Microbacterium protaetiae TaxID=2509458 RepID=A0A4P6ECP0_9MICO|nr:magnesium transporter [Microbacterium protaetiae]QAY59406.1 magnesium transporter [Microbacterium protaetiae]
MTIQELTDRIDDLALHIEQGDLVAASDALTGLDPHDVVTAIERMSPRDGAVLFRLLAKDRALAVFEALAPAVQADLVRQLREVEVAAMFADLDPDDRVWLLDELPAAVARALLLGLPERERQLTADVLGYPQNAIGRRMNPDYVTTHPDLTVAQTMARIRAALGTAETVYTLPVTDHGREVVGVVSLRDLMSAPDDARVREIMSEPHTATATSDAEQAARLCADMSLLALPVVDSERRLVGILTLDDAARILKREESEDAARQGGVEPLGRPYLSTPITRLVRSRVVWLLVLAVGATLTVQVLEIFEATLAQLTALALFVPLLIGTGGNTGNQAATTVTRALALDEVRPRDILRVLGRELRVGFLLGLALGCLGFVIAGAIYAFPIGLVIGLTLAAVCTVAATIGGIMPLVARAIHVDPAVFSNPFITTFVDATGLVIYFLIAKAVLGI